MSGSLVRRAGLLLAVSTLTFTSFGAPAAHADETYVVNRAIDDDDGSCDAMSSTTDCTLREAINAANNDPEFDRDTIEFSLPTNQTTIEADSELPAILEPIIINGLTQPGATATQPLVQIDGQYAGTTATGLWLSGGSSNSIIRGLVVNRFGYQQILVDTANATVRDNFLGVDAEGTAAIESPAFGTLRVRVGGDGALIENNVVGSLSSAPAISLTDVSQVRVSDNYVGVSRGREPLGSGANSPGIRLTGSGSDNSIRDNNIGANGGLGIDLGLSGPDGVTANDPGDADTGPNGLQNYPVIDTAVRSGSAMIVTGSLDSTPSTTFLLDFYNSPQCDPTGFGEGVLPLGTRAVTTGADGKVDFEFEVGATLIGSQVTATATAPGGGTSEFSACSESLPAAPRAPQGVTAAAGDEEAVVEWLVPDLNGGVDVDFYTVTSTPDTASTPVTVQAPQTQTTIPDLVNGTEYTFTVTATNNEGRQSPASEPSDPVSPAAGAPAPQTATGDLAPAGQLTTGASATPTDPTNTTVVSPNGGVVSIGEGVTEQPAPDGGDYYGQQVDLTAPDATATDPLRFTFVVDCSVLPTTLQNCTSPPENPRATVSVRDASFAPRQATVDLGGTVQWRFTGKRRHSVTESVGLGSRRKPLFDSGAKPRGAKFSQTFRAAGSYAYRSRVRGDSRRMTGTVGVPVDVEPAGGGSAVTWSTGLSAGTAADVQYRHRATADAPWSRWTTWRNDTRTRSAVLGAGVAGRGDYHLRSRLVNIRTGRTSGWSPRSTATVGGRLAAIDVWHQTDLGDPLTNAIVPDCTGPDGVAEPAPSCVWSEQILPDGDLRIVVYSTRNGRWRVG